MALWACSPTKRFFLKSAVSSCLISLITVAWQKRAATDQCHRQPTRPVTFSPRRNGDRRLTDDGGINAKRLRQRRSCHLKKRTGLTLERECDIRLAVAHLWKGQACLRFKIHSSAPPSFAQAVTFSNCIMRKTEEGCVSSSLLLCTLNLMQETFLASRVKLDKRHGDVSCCLPFILLLGYQQRGRFFQTPAPALWLTQLWKPN